MKTLNELFDKGKYPWKKTKSMSGYYNYRFETSNGQKYRVYMSTNEYSADELNIPDSYENDNGDVEAYEIVFTLKDENTNMPTTKTTGTGDEIRVFSTVLDILKDFKKSVKPKVMFFSAKEPSRRKLYDRLVKKFGQGYTVSTFKSSDDKGYTLYK